MAFAGFGVVLLRGLDVFSDVLNQRGRSPAVKPPRLHETSDGRVDLADGQRWIFFS